MCVGGGVCVQVRKALSDKEWKGSCGEELSPILKMNKCYPPATNTTYIHVLYPHYLN